MGLGLSATLWKYLVRHSRFGSVWMIGWQNHEHKIELSCRLLKKQTTFHTVVFRNTKMRVRAGCTDRYVLKTLLPCRCAVVVKSKQTAFAACVWAWTSQLPEEEKPRRHILGHLAHTRRCFSVSAEWTAALLPRRTQVFLHQSNPSGWERKVFPHLHVHLYGKQLQRYP